MAGWVVAILSAVVLGGVSIAGLYDVRVLSSRWMERSARFWERVIPPTPKLLPPRSFQVTWWSFVLAFALALLGLGCWGLTQ
jgi:hypothetical protein